MHLKKTLKTGVLCNTLCEIAYLIRKMYKSVYNAIRFITKLIVIIEQIRKKFHKIKCANNLVLKS